MPFQFPGGVEAIDFDDTGSFDVAAVDAPSTFVITANRNSIAGEGNTWPEPAKVVAALHDGREIKLGIDIPFTLRFTDVPTPDVDTLEEQANTGAEVFVRFTSMALAADGATPSWQATYKRVILSNVVHSPVAARGSYGTVVVEGMTTGFSSAETYTITTTE